MPLGISGRISIPKHSGLELMKISLFGQEESHLQFLSEPGPFGEEWGKIHLRDQTFFCASTRKEGSNFFIQGLDSQPISRERWKVPRLKGRVDHKSVTWDEDNSSARIPGISCFHRIRQRGKVVLANAGRSDGSA